MPHLTLEYSNRLASHTELTELLKTLHETVGHSESVNIETLKSRLVERDTYFIGADTSRRAFLFARLEVLPGRSPAWKKQVGSQLHQLLMEKVKGWIPPTINCSINVEIQELNDEFYFRTPPPS